MSNVQYQMSNMEEESLKKDKNYDIHERIFRFVINVLGFLNKIPYSYSNQVYKGQVTRSVTSMGANDQEADGAFSTKDFIHCFIIVRKESKETVYWLRIIKATLPKLESESEILIKEGLEIVAIVSKIIRNTQSNPRKILN